MSSARQYITKYCILCGRKRPLQNPDYIPKKLLLQQGDTYNDLNELGYICDGCNDHIAAGGAFKKI